MPTTRTRAASAMRATRVARVVVGLGLAGGLATGMLSACSVIRDPNAGAQHTESTPSPAPAGTASPTGPPTDFDGTASTALPEDDVIDAGAGRRSVATLTKTTLTLHEVPGLATTGTVEPAAGSYTDVLVDRTADTAYVLAVESRDGRGTNVGGDRFTVQQVDLASGSATRTATVAVRKDPRGSAQPATARIVAVQRHTALVDSWVPGSDGAHTVVAIDLDRGRLAWRAHRSLLLASTPSLAIVDTGRAQEPGRVEALRLGSGERAWTALPGTLGASAVGVTRSEVVIAREDAVFRTPTIVRLSLTGGKAGTPQQVADWNWSCTPSGAASVRSTAVCTLADTHEVLGYDLDRGRVLWSLPGHRRFAPGVTLVQDGLVYGLLDNGVGVVLDALTGRDLTADSDAAPVAANGYGAVVLYANRAFFVPFRPGTR